MSSSGTMDGLHKVEEAKVGRQSLEESYDLAAPRPLSPRPHEESRDKKAEQLLSSEEGEVRDFLDPVLLGGLAAWASSSSPSAGGMEDHVEGRCMKEKKKKSTREGERKVKNFLTDCAESEKKSRDSEGAYVLPYVLNESAPSGCVPYCKDASLSSFSSSCSAASASQCVSSPTASILDQAIRQSVERGVSDSFSFDGQLPWDLLVFLVAFFLPVPDLCNWSAVCKEWWGVCTLYHQPLWREHCLTRFGFKYENYLLYTQASQDKVLRASRMQPTFIHLYIHVAQHVYTRVCICIQVCI